MDTLVSILLYMHVIAYPGTYTMGQLNDLITANENQIELIENDPTQLSAILGEYEPEAIVIIDSTEG